MTELPESSLTGAAKRLALVTLLVGILVALLGVFAPPASASPLLHPQTRVAAIAEPASQLVGPHDFVLAVQGRERAPNYGSSETGSSVAAEGGGSSLPGSDLAGKAPLQVEPGVTSLSGQYVNDLGRVEPWTACYDQYGRLIGPTDYNAGSVTQGIADAHYHVYEWGPGQNPEEVLTHIPGEYPG